MCITTAISVSGAGDINGDGYADLIVGAPLVKVENVNNVGTSYIVYGQAASSDINLSDFDYSNIAGFKVVGADFDGDGGQSGYSVSGAGDFDADGFDDVIIGAPYFNQNPGASYVVYGGPSNYDRLSVTLDNLTDPDIKSLVGGHENDTLTWNGKDAVLIGGAGDDELVINHHEFKRIDGGNGKDTLRFDSQMDLNLPDYVLRASIKNIEVIDMDDPASTLTLTVIDVLNLSATSNTLEVRGNNSDKLNLEGDGWNKDGVNSTYTNGLAIVQVSGGVQVNLNQP